MNRSILLAHLFISTLIIPITHAMEKDCSAGIDDPTTAEIFVVVQEAIKRLTAFEERKEAAKYECNKAIAKKMGAIGRYDHGCSTKAKVLEKLPWSQRKELDDAHVALAKALATFNDAEDKAQKAISRVENVIEPSAMVAGKLTMPTKRTDLADGECERRLIAMHEAVRMAEEASTHMFSEFTRATALNAQMTKAIEEKEIIRQRIANTMRYQGSQTDRQLWDRTLETTRNTEERLAILRKKLLDAQLIGDKDWIIAGIEKEIQEAERDRQWAEGVREQIREWQNLRSSVDRGEPCCIS